nr:Major facilitator superfamily protein [Ipomoea trifida]
MCIFLCMGGNSPTWMNTAVLVTCIRSRGSISGILKGYVGLSTFTDLCLALFADDPARFLLMLAVIPFMVSLFWKSPPNCIFKLHKRPIVAFPNPSNIP